MNKRVKFSGVFDWLSENLIEQRAWTPTINAGCVITSQDYNYYKIGKLVYVTAALWVDASSGTDEDVQISLPFPCATVRAYGTIGYFDNMGNFPQLKAAVIRMGADYINITYAPVNSRVVNLKGNQMGNVQFSIVYLTDK